ncbi:MAG TPA: hypothetical protein VFQ35_04570, partial [Polyangiaceae bacterium]|nr:hypothetical protein [Polyangiaceae bacterium]
MSARPAGSQNGPGKWLITPPQTHIPREVIASAAVFRGLAHAAWLIFLARPASATLFAELSVARTESAADCPSASALTERVERIRHATVRPPAAAPTGDVVFVEVGFGRAAGAYSARLAFRGPKRGERELVDSSATCEALAEAVSLAIALALDQSEEPEGSTPSAPATERARPPAARDAAERTGSQEATQPSGHDERLGLGASLESGAAFAFGAPVSLSLGARARGSYRG